MEQQPPLQPAQPAQSQKQGMSTGAKVGLGCGGGCLLLVVLCAIGVFVGYGWVMGKVEGWETEFAEKGLKTDQGSELVQLLQVTEVPTEPTYYKGQTVVLNFSEPVTVEIGVIAQQMNIQQGTFAENVYFRGQIATVQSGANLQKELNVECQIVQEMGGTIEGGVTGTYQAKQ